MLGSNISSSRSNRDAFLLFIVFSWSFSPTAWPLDRWVIKKIVLILFSNIFAGVKSPF
jgi:hypothetical protein